MTRRNGNDGARRAWANTELPARYLMIRSADYYWKLCAHVTRLRGHLATVHTEPLVESDSSSRGAKFKQDERARVQGERTRLVAG